MNAIFLIKLLLYATKDQNVLRSPHALLQAVYDLRIASTQQYLDWVSQQPNLQQFVIPDLDVNDRKYDDLSVINVGVNYAYGSVDQTLWGSAIHWINIYSKYDVDYIVTLVNQKFNELSNGEIAQFMNTTQYDWYWYISLFSMVTFKPAWKYGLTGFFKMGFHVNEDLELTTTFMERTGLRLNYGKIEDFEAVELPLKNPDYNVLILLPMRGKNIDHYVRGMDTNRLLLIYSQMEQTNISVRIPRNTFEDWHYAKNIFLQSNLPKPFSESIFQPVKDQTARPLNEIVQRLKVVFDTKVESDDQGLTETKKPILFTANRPFWFLLVDRQLNITLLIGQIIKPGKKIV
ncbi:serpin H1-like [Uranotaenia lowii]|uniref:serpin H1-like n=1 Tax=Uranotaenia lowii TaxID=190385 RepID=UPI002478BE26|nr:serpin H1-like [Uranotaenia lowii]